ncbi:MAG: tyrosine-type recombinase/integrase [Verrucomicrobia bacterium]|nr:tyrosine-type recombinase/integrase [Verrucomicrobiota bacterium]
MTRSLFTMRQCQRQGIWELVSGDGQPVEQAERFIHTLVLRGLSPQTRRAYAYDLLEAYRWMDEVNRHPEQITGDDLIAFIDYMQRPPPASPATINRRLRLLQRFVAFLTGDTPVVAAWRQHTHALSFHSRSRRGSVRIKEPHRVIHPLTDAEVMRFYASLKTWRDRSMMLLMWAEGLRSAEVLNLTVKDIDDAAHGLRILGKGRKQRVMPLADAAANTLRLYAQLERPITDSPSMFVVLKGPRRGQPLSAGGLRRLFRYHRGKSGIKQANPHRFRHCFGANMTRGRVPLLVLARMMGHSSPHTTMRYVEIEDPELRTHYLEALDVLKAKGLHHEGLLRTDP